MSPIVAYGIYLLFAIGAAALYFLMPQLGRAHKVIGASLGIAALAALALAFGLKELSSDSHNIAFACFAVLAIAAATRVITHTKPVYSALYFVAVVISVAGMVLLAGAEFLAFAILIIYAGAILVTYVFVIMLAQQAGSPVYDRAAREPMLAIVAGFFLAAMITVETSGGGRRGAGSTFVELEANSSSKVQLVSGVDAKTPMGEAVGETMATTQPIQDGNALEIGALVMTQYVVALQVAGLLLLIAMVGAIGLSRKRVPFEGLAAPLPQLGEAGRHAAPY